VWAYVNPRVVPTPPEFEVPAPAVAAAHLAMLRYNKLNYWGCRMAPCWPRLRQAPCCGVLQTSPWRKPAAWSVAPSISAVVAPTEGTRPLCQLRSYSRAHPGLCGAAAH